MSTLSSILNSNAERVEELFQLQLRSGDVSSLRTCCDERLVAVMQFDDHFNTAVTKASACDVSPSILTQGAFSPGLNLSDVFRHNLEENANIKWQYFMSVWGIHSEFPAHSTHCHLNRHPNDIPGSVLLLPLH